MRIMDVGNKTKSFNASGVVGRRCFQEEIGAGEIKTPSVRRRGARSYIIFTIAGDRDLVAKLL